MNIDLRLYDRVKKITRTNYSNDRSEADVWVDEDGLYAIIEDLVNEVEFLEAKIKDIEQDIEDNYRPIPLNEQYNVYDSDFI